MVVRHRESMNVGEEGVSVSLWMKGKKKGSMGTVVQKIEAGGGGYRVFTEEGKEEEEMVIGCAFQGAGGGEVTWVKKLLQLL